MRKFFNLFILSAKYVCRNRTRSFLTMVGVATGMFLFATIETMQNSLKDATVASANDTNMIVYRENRFCPSTSRLPEYYKEEIQKIEGVSSVVPIQIVVNNCGTSLDVVVFRGIHKSQMNSLSKDIHFLEGSIAEWLTREDGALVGVNLAKRRKLKVGDSFDAAGVTVTVSGIIRSTESSQDENVAYVNLPFLQQASRVGLGVVTQFAVKVENSSYFDSVAEKIDQRFKSESEPTHTAAEKAFFASTAKELIELIQFTRWIGIASVFAVVGLIANTILIAVRGKVSEFAVLKTLGFQKSSLASLILFEGVIISLSGGLLGVLSAILFLNFNRVTIGNEGLALAFIPDYSVLLTGICISLTLGVIAGLYPAWYASKNSIVENLRAT